MDETLEAEAVDLHKGTERLDGDHLGDVRGRGWEGGGGGFREIGV